MLASAWLATSLGLLASAQCINNLAKYHPTERTACNNATSFLVAMDKAEVQKMVPFPLLPLPTGDKSLFTQNFPSDKHIVLVTSAYMNDIRQFDLEINRLNQASLLIPYVNRVAGSGVPFLYGTYGYIGSAGDQASAGLIPGLVGSAEGNTLFQAQFDPEEAPYKYLGGGSYSRSVKQVIIPNPISGPGVIPTVIDFQFQTISKNQSPFTEKLFLRATNQAEILNNGIQCQYNLAAANETFSNPVFRKGDVTLYNIDGTLKGLYPGQYGLSVASQWVGVTATTCEDAAKAYQSTLSFGQ